MDILDLKVGQRNTFGKGPARDLRRRGLIPAILYGLGKASTALVVSPLELRKLYKASGTEQVILNLIIENGQARNATVMVKEVQISPVTREYLHIDFLEIALDEEIVIKIQVEVTGKSKGVERGGFLQVVRHELEIACLPTDMPEKISVDVSELDIGDTLHIGDIETGDKVRLLAEPELTVITVVPPAMEEEEVVEEELEEAVEGADEAESAGGEKPGDTAD